MVGSGIFLSRIVGLVRNRMLAHYFGTSGIADAFSAALRIPNFLQNLFGEGVLSASFIPVYSRLLAQEDREEARKVAGAVAALLAVVVAALVLLGVLLTPALVDLVAGGFEGGRRDLTVRLVRILFPGTGLLVLSAWCLGILNSHHRFLLAYSAPALWNLAIIASLVLFGGRTAESGLAVVAAWGSVAGSALQLLVQLPSVLHLLGRLHLRLSLDSAHVRTVIRNFGPVFIGRGVVQISAYVDTVLASYLPIGAVAALSYAQALYLLPVSLFGMSVSVAELPVMSSATGSADEVAAYLRGRLEAGLRQIAFYIVPSAVVFLVLGDVVAGALYQSGNFTRELSVYVWAILAGSSVGLLASTMGRLYASTFYALHDTRTPLRFGVVRVALTVVIGYLFAFPLPVLLGIDPKWGAAGLTASAGVAGWIEFLLLRDSLSRRIGRVRMPLGFQARLWLAAALAAAAGWGMRSLLPVHRPIVLAIFVLGAFGLVYLGAAAALGVPQAGALTRRLTGARGPNAG
jgi:putative peptidoglycan lipid II flippase